MLSPSAFNFVLPENQIKNQNDACFLQVFDAIAIDSRRRDDDTPWDETKELITKNTPFFGFLCMQKNNNHVGYQCSDYKASYTSSIHRHLYGET